MKSFALAFQDVGFEGAIIHVRVFQFGKSVYAPFNMQDAPTGLIFLKCDCVKPECTFKDWTMLTEIHVERNTIASAFYLVGSGQLAVKAINEDDKAWMLAKVGDIVPHNRWLALSDLCDVAITEAMMSKMMGSEGRIGDGE